MSIQWMDNFQNYGTNSGTDTMLDGTLWADLQGDTADCLITDPDPNASGQVFRFSGTGSGTNLTRLVLSTPTTKVGAAFRLWLPDLPVSTIASPAIHFRTAANGTPSLFYLRVEPNGALSIYKAGVLVVTTTVPVVLARSWNHLEILIDTVTGNVKVWKEGVAIAVLTYVDGAPLSSVIGTICFSNQTAAGVTSVGYIKDLVIYDGLGTQNNSQCGPVTVYSLRPNSDVSSGWTRSTGATDYGLLDESTPDDADYISAPDTLPAASIMGLEDLPSDVVAVRGLMVFARMRKTDGGDGKVQMSMISSGVAGAGTDRAISTAFTYYYDISEVDPNTTALWTRLGVNAAQVKINRTL